MKILVANRGEIAVRVMRACREMQLTSVAVYSACDRTAPHVRRADEAYAIGSNEPADSYLRIDRIVDAARRAAADAVHPGYGFLAENADFARACRDAGLLFIGPAPDVIALMGRKTAAREAARRAGVPVVPGTDGPLDESLSEDDIPAVAAEVGYPLFVKAVAGGGGKGMRLATGPAELPSALRGARSEARSAFGDPTVYLERRLERPRHLEIQLLADQAGRMLPFVERECSIQRRHQKVLEEAPSPVVTRELRESLAAAAVAIAREVGYTNAGTIEFLLDENGRYYFLEMNTRLQVEHPVTELVTGVDLVQWQIRIARGERLTLAAERLLSPEGHAIECRIYAEDPDNGFLPSPGQIRHLRVPSGPGIRDDSGVEAGSSVPVFYDSLLSKLVAWGEDRNRAVARMRRALEEYEIAGIKTTIPFFRWMLEQPDFREGRFDTTVLDRMLASRGGQPFLELSAEAEDLAVMAAALHTYLRARNTETDSRNRASEWQQMGRLEGLRS